MKRGNWKRKKESVGAARERKWRWRRTRITRERE